MYILKGRENYENSDTRQHRHHGQPQRLRRAPFSAFPLRKRASCCAKHTITASAFSTPHARIRTANIRSSALADVRDDIIIATKTASTTVEGFWERPRDEPFHAEDRPRGYLPVPHAALLPEARRRHPACMKRCWKRKRRARSVTSASRIIACMWRAKPWNPAYMKRCSSRFATLRAKRTLSL